MRNNRTQKIILIVLCVVLTVILALSVAFARYLSTWEKDFGLTIQPVSSENILAPNTSGTLFDPDTRHIVFGRTQDYTDVTTTLASTKKHVGEGDGDAIYTYYDAETDTTYVLCEETIYFPANSSGMFKDLTKLESITFDNYSTQYATTMEEMFSGCESLTVLDLTGFTTPQILSMRRMFYNCSSLGTVYAEETFATTSVISDGDMFTGCYTLVGGNGTRVYPAGSTETTQPLDKTYARIDGLDLLEGYFTGPGSEKYYFRSNELMPVSQNVSYTVDGTAGWFTVANALDSQTWSTGVVDYTLSYFVSEDGNDWISYQTGEHTMDAGRYQVDKYELAPIQVNDTTYHWIKVTATTTSFLQEDLQAVYHFVPTGLSTEYGYADGVITLTIHTNNHAGTYRIGWASGIAPDNSDPSGTFSDAAAGASTLDVYLEKNTVYQYLFFVTDSAVLSALEGDASQAGSYVTVGN